MSFIQNQIILRISHSNKCTQMTHFQLEIRPFLLTTDCLYRAMALVLITISGSSKQYRKMYTQPEIKGHHLSIKVRLQKQAKISTIITTTSLD